ncbi:hypothetical protein BLX88_10365 [Bacillus obstructivus]|nr:hypothetical protein BLX88_10365 [Bacillus obstructivus]
MNTKAIPPLETTAETEHVRSQMIESGMTKGLHHPSTLELSKKLDTLLNAYNHKQQHQDSVAN